MVSGIEKSRAGTDYLDMLTQERLRQNGHQVEIPWRNRPSLKQYAVKGNLDLAPVLDFPGRGQAESH
jgi:hypothetical protein